MRLRPLQVVDEKDTYDLGFYGGTTKVWIHDDRDVRAAQRNEFPRWTSLAMV